jgi:ferritin-like metal-binding protein YciE
MPLFFCAPTRPGTLQDRRCGSTAGRGFCDEGAGSRVRLGPAFNSVHSLQNNDQIGNRAVGDRLHTGINPDLNAASTEMLLLAPKVRQRKRPRTTVSPRFLRLTARSDNPSRPVASDAQSETAHSPASWNFKAIFLLSRRQFIPLNKEHDMPTKTFEDLFTDGIKDIYYAERKIVAGLKKMIRGAQSPDLKAAFEKHLQETEGQVERLVQVFELIGKPARGKTCPAIDGILEEGQEILEEFKGSDALDAGLLASAQAVEHYEIARYGTLRSWALQLGKPDVAQLLEQTLAEETATDEALTQLAEGNVNRKGKQKAA